MSSSSSSSPVFSNDSSFSLASSSCRQFSLDEIKEATNNFDEKKVIGHGGEGKVYLAEIYLDSKTKRARVAVKQLNKDSTDFEKEVRIVSIIKHPNLVSLLGYCNESDEKILIYEYMENRCLSDYVKMDSIVCLPWKQRLNICLGAAYGLQHLHKKTNERPKGIIHRDVKPANILLDRNWVAKVSDFGILKSSNAAQINSTIITAIKGTRGYFAPEYVMSNHISRKIDVYSFGVVMFEVLCQKSPWDRDVSYYHKENEDLGDWALENIDSKIKADVSDDSLKEFTDAIRRSLQRDPSRRPTMDDVVLTLETALKCQEHEDEQTLKALRVRLSMMEKKAYDDSLDIPRLIDIARSTRDAPPAHYTLEIESFSQLVQMLSDTRRENYESNIFEASGYKWKLSLYPNDNKERNGEGHISLYLVIADTKSLPKGWEVKVNIQMFVFDQVHGTYSIFQDNNGKLRNYNESNTKFGFDKLLPLNVFNDPTNGFLTRDKCVFGVEVYALNKSRGECLSSKQKVEAIHNFKIDFHSFQDLLLYHDTFTWGNSSWKIRIYTFQSSEYVTIYLQLQDTQMKGKAYVDFRVRIRDQLRGKHKDMIGNAWFDNDGWKNDSFKKSDLYNASLGFVVKNTLIVEVEIISISRVNKLM